ncbi:MAG: RDD family protein [Verrucomicrobiota bacterium]
MEFFIGKDGEKLGPLSLYQLREMLEEGEIDGDTMGWMRGLESWLPIREISPVLGVIQTLERERLDEELAQRDAPPPIPEPPIPYHRLPSHGVSRYGARMIDVLLLQVLLVFLLPDQPESFPNPGDVDATRAYLQRILEGEIPEGHLEFARRAVVIQGACLVGFWLMEALLLSLFGTTPGKALFRLQVVSYRNGNPSFLRALGRAILVFWLGMAGRIPFLEWAACFLAFVRLQNRGNTLWDKQMETTVQQKPITRLRFYLILLVFLGIAGLVITITQGQQPSP